MRATRLKLNYYRNYETLDLKPESGLNVIVGENAQGKTNAVEALFFCAFGRSHRTPRDQELINRGMSGAYVGLEAQTKSGERRIEMKLRAGERKKVFLDRLETKRTGELMGVINVVMFSPEDLELIKGAPAERRRFLDMELSQIRPAYYYRLQQYNAALKQRNALLKGEPGRERPTAVRELRDELYVWDEQLAAAGADVMRMRMDFTRRLASVAEALHYRISGGRERLQVSYEASVDASEYGGNLRGALEEVLYASAYEDIRRGYTTVGPHRDDLSVTFGGESVRTYGSQGQQRTAALSLKLSELQLLKEEKGEAPILLLDDVLSELDDPRQRALVEAMEGCQCFLTCTSLAGLERAGMKDIHAYRCENGTLREM
ncbi:MAG: DNA replication/repair protein RecF [Clostridia bacterium]|nr:DNA replication/repair protein RecF [Clostridia bacterium]